MTENPGAGTAAPTIGNLDSVAAHEPDEPAVSAKELAAQRETQALEDLMESLARAPQDEREPEPDILAAVDADTVYAYATDKDEGAAKLFTLLNRGRYLYDELAKEWVAYTGTRWDVRRGSAWITEGFSRVRAVINHHARAEMKKAADESLSKEDRKTHRHRAEKLARAHDALAETKVKRAAGAQAAAADMLGNPGESWDKKPNLLPVANGVVDLRTGELHATGNPDDLLSIGSPIALDVEAECPAFEKFIFEILGDNARLVEYFHRWIGYAVCRNPAERVLLFLVGAGSNGKSLLIETLCHVLGPISATVKTELLLERRGADNPDAPTASRMSLRGRGPAFASEIKKGAVFDEATLKSLTGKDTITARAPHEKRETSFEPTHTFAIACNDLPYIDPRADAVWSRVKKLVFPVSFVPPEKMDKANPNPMHKPIDRALGEKLRKEAPGILRWIVAGARAYNDPKDGGLKEPEEVRLATEQYRRDVDVIGDFLEERCQDDPHAETRARALYTAYRKWAEENGTRPKGEKTFSTDIMSRGKYTREEDKRGRYYVGLALKEDEDA